MIESTKKFVWGSIKITTQIDSPPSNREYAVAMLRDQQEALLAAVELLKAAEVMAEALVRRRG